MNVLFLTHRVPYAPNRGDRIRAWHLIREMSAYAKVSLFSLAHDAHEASRLSQVPATTAAATVTIPKLGKYLRGLAQLPGSRPLTHALLGAQFTATSMIGMIALAGIIVRNSILLVDFIHLRIAEGAPFARAVIESAAVRAQPIVLTAVAAMMGALFILDDPIFNGLAISLLFGIAVSTLLTLVVIPLLFYVAYRGKYERSLETGGDAVT